MAKTLFRVRVLQLARSGEQRQERRASDGAAVPSTAGALWAEPATERSPRSSNGLKKGTRDATAHSSFPCVRHIRSDNSACRRARAGAVARDLNGRSAEQCDAKLLEEGMHTAMQRSRSGPQPRMTGNRASAYDPDALAQRLATRQVMALYEHRTCRGRVSVRCHPFDRFGDEPCKELLVDPIAAFKEGEVLRRGRQRRREGLVGTCGACVAFRP